MGKNVLVYHNNKESILQNFFLTLDRRQYYAQVFCNHDPPAPGNSGDFDFWSSNPRLKPHLAGTAVFASSLLSFHFTTLFACIKQSPGISPAPPWQNFGQIPAHFHGYPPPSPGGGRGVWLQMNSALK